MAYIKSRRLLVWLVVIVLCLTVLPGYASSSLEEKIKQSQQELSRIQQHLESRTQQLEEYQSEEQRLLREWEDLRYSLTLLRNQLAELENEIESVENSIAVAEHELALAEEQIQVRDDLLKKRLRAIYENGDTGYLEVLFSAYSFAEFLTRLNDLKLIAEKDLELLEVAYQERAAIEEKKEALEEEKARLLNLRVERLERREELNSKMARQEQMLDEIQKEVEAQERAIRDLEQESAKVDQLISELQERMRRQTEHLTPSGQLLWPLAEYGTSWITSPFGYRTHPITGRAGVFHGGVDIGIPHSRWPGSSSYNGNPVYIRAGDNGVVAFAGVKGGYGNTVIMAHGKDIYTLYAHCHSLLVSENEEVSRGQAIAIVGSTGFSTGPHLHFEYRVGNQRKDPMSQF